MIKRLFMGIDGGGSTLRVAIVDENLDESSSLAAGAVNPSIVGRDAARERIQEGVLQSMRLADIQQEDIAAVGIGIAGASNLHSEDWLRETLKPALPSAHIVASSDLEIALVGALGQRKGLLVLAGTGSAVFGVSTAGRRLQVGGWGYLLGDQGSSFWIGTQLLKHVATTFDIGGERSMTALGRACLDKLGLTAPRELVAWVYRSEQAPAVRIACLAPFVLRRADAGDELARDILRGAARHLAEQLETIRRRVNDYEAPIAFAGGLLESDNWLSSELAKRLNLPARPAAKYPPVVGAALLAMIEWSAIHKL
ncbi:MAG: hypothetical protein OXG53_07920 [Chloroflexi bacterium]|nr:hypothetical protein [Chloroflexota bacterium]